MTTSERIQLEKDILYEHHKASGELSAQIVKLKRMHSGLQVATEKLKRFIDYVEGGNSVRREGAPTASMPEVDMKQIESECALLVALREKIDQLQADKKGLGL